MEWQEWKDSFCKGCGLPRHETFADPPPGWPLTRGHWEDRYDTKVLVCAACASLQRKQRLAHDHKGMPAAGLYFAVDPPDFDDWTVNDG